MRRRMTAGFLVVLIVSGVAAALAQQPAQAPSQGEFVPVEELPQHEQLPAAPLLIAAYAFVWVALLAYVFSVWRRLGKVGRELDELTRRLAEKERRA